MQDLPTPLSLLQTIFTLGECLCDALEADELDRFMALTEERGTLIDTLLTYDQPADGSPAWTALAEAMAVQHGRLEVALAEQEARMRETMEALQRFKGARQSYGAPARPASGILDGNLRG